MNDNASFNKKLKQSFSIRTALMIAVVLAVGYFLLTTEKEQTQEKISINQDAYYAVFLSNGQVYFGKMAHISESFFSLEDIYYLQFITDLQTSSEEGGNESQEQPELSLMKLGSEIHGPKDRMDINREHILFYEELSPDSRVVESIQAAAE